MEKLSFTDLYNILDILSDQIRNETDKNKLKILLYKHNKVRKTISKKQKEVIKQIQNKMKNEKIEVKPKDWSFKI